MKVLIRRNADGLIRALAWPGQWDEGDRYMWSDGNSACDCQRGDFFHDAAGEPRDYETEGGPLTPCGDIVYSVRIEDDFGKEVYRDGDWEERCKLAVKETA